MVVNIYASRVTCTLHISCILAIILYIFMRVRYSYEYITIHTRCNMVERDNTVMFLYWVSLAKDSHCEPCGVRPGSSSGGQFDQPCKLKDGAIPAQLLCQRIESPQVKFHTENPTFSHWREIRGIRAIPGIASSRTMPTFYKTQPAETRQTACAYHPRRLMVVWKRFHEHHQIPSSNIPQVHKG